jgi:hypothetical protein
MLVCMCMALAFAVGVTFNDNVIEKKREKEKCLLLHTHDRRPARYPRDCGFVIHAHFVIHTIGQDASVFASDQDNERVHATVHRVRKTQVNSASEHRLQFLMCFVDVNVTVLVHHLFLLFVV